MTTLPQRHFDEAERSSVLHSYDILDTPTEAEFDDLAAIAAEVCQTPIAVVNFVDTHRQFFKAEVGLGVRETPLETSFCGHAILEEDLMVIPDAEADPRFACNPLVAGGLRFYAGAILRTGGGVPIGTICVLDTRPRDLDDHQIRTLRLLARQAMTQLDLRRALAETRRLEARHRQVLASAADYAIVTLDLDGTVIGWNRGAENVLGWTEAEMIGKPAAMFFDETDRQAGVPEREMRAARDTGRGMDERWHLRKDGARFFALGEMMPLRDDADRHIGYVKILRDRTPERKQAQRLELLARASAALLESDDPAATLRPVLEGAADMIGFEHCYLFDLTEDGEELELRHSVGVEDGFRTLLRKIAVDVPLCGLVARSGKRTILQNLQDSRDPRHDLARSTGLRAYAGFPVRVGRKLIGVMSFASTETDNFDADAVSFFHTAARLLSVAREKADAAQSLRAAERRFRLSQEAGGIGTFELDVATGEMVVSDEFCRIFGVPVQPSHPAATFEALVLPEDAAVRSGGADRASGAAELNVEYRIHRADTGELRWLLRQAEFILDDAARVRTMLGTVQDVTDRKKAEIRQEALLSLGEALRNAKGRDEIAVIACRTLMTTLRVTRAGYSRIDRRSGLSVVEHDRVAEGLPSIAGTALDGGDRIMVDRGAERCAQIAVPLFARGEVAGHLFVQDTAPRDWTRGEIDFTRRVADRAYAALAQAEAEREQAILNQELSHRLKNSLSMVQAIATQTLRKTVAPDVLDGFLRRVHALSAAHDALLHRNWEAAPIDETIRSTIGNIAQIDRFAMDGPPVELGPRSTLTLSMLLHELATNAMKYGALSNERGRVAVSWVIEPSGEEPDLALSWQESGGPPVTEPVRRGFGSRLISLGLAGTGGVDVRYQQSGLVVKIRAPLQHMKQS